MKTWLISGLALLLAGTSARADEQLRRVQEELRRRWIYFGEIDGRKTPELTGAIQRYQERKNFRKTGDVDGDLLRSLGLSAPLAAVVPYPDTAVLRSDTARELAEKDRALLEQIERTEATPDDGEKADALEEPIPEVAPQPEQPAPPVALAPAIEPLEKQAETFVRDYLAACETNELPAEMAFYAPRVEYFDHGTVDRKFIEKDVSRYYRRWPKRDYELLDFKLGKVSGEELEVRFKISFRVANASHAVPGRTLNTFRILRTQGEMQFVSLRERRARE